MYPRKQMALTITHTSHTIHITYRNVSVLYRLYHVNYLIHTYYYTQVYIAIATRMCPQMYIDTKETCRQMDSHSSIQTITQAYMLSTCIASHTNRYHPCRHAGTEHIIHSGTIYLSKIVFECCFIIYINQLY